MFKLGKRIVCTAAAAGLVLAGLVGCGPADPTNAQELMDRYNQAENHDNYHADLVYDMNMGALGQSFDMTMNMQMDIAGDNAHSTMTYDMLDESTSAEIYSTKDEDGDGYVQYVSMDITGGDTRWMRSTADTASFAAEALQDDLLEDASFEKTDDGYTLTVDGKKLLDAMDSLGLGDLSNTLSLLGAGDLSDLMDISDVVYTYDKDCLLTGLSMTMSMDYSLGDSSNAALSMSINMDMKMTVSGYGTVDEKTVIVPDDVKESAVDTGDLSDLSSLLGEEAEEEIEEENLAA